MGHGYGGPEKGADPEDEAGIQAAMAAAATKCCPLRYE